MDNLAPVSFFIAVGRIDAGPAAIFGRLAAGYSLVDAVFTTPVEPDLLRAHGRRPDRKAADDE